MTFFCIVLHTLGSCLLISIYRHTSHRPQVLYLLSLSMCEALYNFIRLLMIPVTEMFVISEDITQVVKVVQGCLNIAACTGISFIYYGSIIYVIFDRFLGIFLRLRYNIYCTVHRAKNAVMLLWLLNFGLILILTLCDKLLSTFTFKVQWMWYVYPCCDIFIICLLFCTYIFIFKEYKFSQLGSLQALSTSAAATASPSTLKLFQNSNFFIPVLLTLSFTVFIALPDLLYFFLIVIDKRKKNDIFLVLARLSYSVSDLLDALIYLFLHPLVREKLAEKVRYIRGYQHVRRTIHRQNAMITRCETETTL